MTALRAPAGSVAIPRHAGLAWRTVLYLFAGVGRGLVALLVLGHVLPTTLLLGRVGIGLGLLDRLAPVAWRLAEVERQTANRLLAAHLGPLGRSAPGTPGRVERSRSEFWRASAMLALRLPVALLGLALSAVPAALALSLLVLGLDGLGGADGQVLGPWTLGPPLGLALLLLAGAAGVVSVATLEGMGRALRVLARLLLGARAAAEGPVRELLAEKLGDRTLTVAYWLPDREGLVDERGEAVELPRPGSRRTWTAVDRDGRRVAAIIHDAELDATPELVNAAAATAALAIDNERLKADLRARVQELRVSRARIVQAGDEARRRLERDLHDGAQQLLVSLALDLSLLRARTRDATTAADLEGLGERLADALAALRELARGLHPAVLTDRGLGPAVAMLAGRAAVPVRHAVEVVGRLPRPVEAAAYFVVAEGLTNVARYARASEAVVEVRRRDQELEVLVADDGAGGASLEAGTGLRGLADRLAALDGSLELDSPPGRGTRLTARIPVREEAP